MRGKFVDCLQLSIFLVYFLGSRKQKQRIRQFVLFASGTAEKERGPEKEAAVHSSQLMSKYFVNALANYEVTTIYPSVS